MQVQLSGVNFSLAAVAVDGVEDEGIALPVAGFPAAFPNVAGFPGEFSTGVERLLIGGQAAIKADQEKLLIMLL
nr:hypothetical protein Iba_chr10eCG15580 [Ipomoea batatas]GMD47713.1 hypothetical protein Iba_chr10eCG15600 [Ipomoea batatas]